MRIAIEFNVGGMRSEYIERNLGEKNGRLHKV
jgi:hypothetical protein